MLGPFPFELEIGDESPDVSLNSDGSSELLKPPSVHVGQEKRLDFHGGLDNAFWHGLLLLWQAIHDVAEVDILVLLGADCSVVHNLGKLRGHAAGCKGEGGLP